MKVLLLENIHPFAERTLIQAGHTVELLKPALGEAELQKKLAEGVEVLGIRSKTMVTDAVLSAGKNLKAVGCFCVGTNQVDLAAAQVRGIPVFNAPFSNTRSVAELVIGEIVFLSRQLGDRVREMHTGRWNKTSNSCFEVRGKTLGIVGYGNIGTQVSMIAESLGMRVMYYDIVSKLSLGNAKETVSLEELLDHSDFVTLHVPATPLTEWMIGAGELARMKRGSYLINASRGNVVVIDALAEALKSGHLAGAAIDVFPEEPEANQASFVTPLQGIPNVLLTPHIGGATEEAQLNIGREVANLLQNYLRFGITAQSVNFPRIQVDPIVRGYRFMNIHKNVPGVLREVTRLVSETGANIESQFLSTDAKIGYLIMDLNRPLAPDVLEAIARLPTSIQTRGQ
jgi:D-3-phosphoglycerate dehydrogenase